MQRLQVVLALMSAFHQSVYNGLTALAQREVLQVQAAHNSDDELHEIDSPSVSGYFLCNESYAPLVYSALCKVLQGEQLRVVTAQTCVYVLRYILTNRIYGETLPYSFIEEFAVMFRFILSSI